MTARDCVELGENGEALVLAARFDRAGAGHAVMIVLDPQECGEAAEILLLDSSELTGALGELRRAAKRDKVRLTTTALDPADFRWRAEAAMDARDHHDRDDRTIRSIQTTSPTAKICLTLRIFSTPTVLRTISMMRMRVRDTTVWRRCCGLGCGRCRRR